MATTDWFYLEAGRREGPMDSETLLRRLLGGASTAQALVWRQGLGGWMTPEALPELRGSLPPPVPDVAMEGSSPSGRLPRESAGAEVAPWFPVSTTKLAVMSLVTFGLYLLYWFYKQWRCAQRRTSEKLYPLLGAVFSGISAYFLFKRVRDAAVERQVATDWTAGGLATAYFLLSALWRLPEPGFLVCFLSFVPVLSVQRTLNSLIVAETPTVDRNARFSAANWIGIVLGGLLFLLAVVGSFMPEA